MLRIGDVGAVVVEGAQCANDAAHDRHRVRIAAKAVVEHLELLVHHRMVVDRVFEIVELVPGRQFAVEQQIGDLHEARLFGELVNRITAMEQHALVAVDKGQA